MAQRRGEKFRVQYNDALGNKKSATFSKKKDADEFKAKMRRERELVRHGLEVPKESVLVIDYTQEWLAKRDKSASRDRGQLSPGTVYSDVQRLTKHFVAPYGLRPLTSISSKDVKEMLDNAQEAEGWSNATRNRLRAALHKLFKDAFMADKVIFNPVDKVPAESERKTRRLPKDPVTEEEFTALLAAALREPGREALNKLFLTILLFEGPRVSEICALKHGDFNLELGTLTFRRIWEWSSGAVREGIKGRPEGKTIPLVAIVKAAYDEYRATLKRSAAGDFVFPDAKNGCVSTDQAKRWLKRWSLAAKVRNINPHLLRASFATLAEEYGMTKEEVQKLMGHSSVQTTELYTRMRIKHLIDRMKSVGFGAVPSTENVLPLKKSDG